MDKIYSAAELRLAKNHARYALMTMYFFAGFTFATLSNESKNRSNSQSKNKNRISVSEAYNMLGVSGDFSTPKSKKHTAHWQ